MQILKRIEDNGTTVGYTIDEGGIILPMCNDALYTELYIRPLTEAGYKYFSRNADEIMDPQGVSLSSYEAIPFSEIDSVEWLASIDLATSSAMSDTDAAAFYSFREESVISFRTEPSYEINTREEFIAYLKGLQNMFYSNNYSIDNRPINAFVNPEALFTIDELIENPEYNGLFNVIIKRHHMRNYTAYSNLIKWLMDKGVLNTATPTMAEFLSAYYAWGPEGLKDKCTNIETKLNVDGLFTYVKDPIPSRTPEDYVLANRENKVVVIDGNQGLHFKKIHESLDSITDIKDFNRSRIIVNSNNNIMAIRRTDTRGYKYQAIQGTAVSDVSDRLYITMISDSGYTYVYKVSHNKIKLGLANTISNSAVFSSSDNFALSSIIPSVSLTLDTIKSVDDYYLWNLAIIKSAKVIKTKTFTPPHKSTGDFLLADGVNPTAAIGFMSNAVANNSGFGVNNKYALSNKMDDMTDALEVYIKDIPDYILASFEIAPEDIEYGIESFLELADVDALRDRREAMMNQKINPGDPGFDYTYQEYQSKFASSQAVIQQALASQGRTAKMYDAVDYYTKLKFVHDCIYGALSIDNFGEGILADVGASYLVAAECIMSVIYAEFGDTPDVVRAANAIADLGESSLIDINRIFKVRDKAFKGYLVDFARYREIRGNEDTKLWGYCTKVFREISNAPIEKQRPYLMEMVVLDKDVKADALMRKLVTKLVSDAIDVAELDTTPYSHPGGSLDCWNDKVCARRSADYIAAKLFFFIIAGGVKDQPVNGVYNVTINMYDTTDLTIAIPVEVFDFIKNFNKEAHKRYITVYDYCKYEYNASMNNFNFVMVNVDIDPWHVRPKKGYSVKTYSLLPNYYEQSSLDHANGSDFYLTAVNNKEICVQPFKKLYDTVFEPKVDLAFSMGYEDDCRAAETAADLMPFLRFDQIEQIFAYVRRWALERKYANNVGKKLYSIPLKQDIVFASLAPIFCEEVPPTEAVLIDDDNFDDKQAQKVTATTVISWRDFQNHEYTLGVSKSSITPFSIEDVELDDALNAKDLIDGTWKSNVPIVVSGNYLNILGEAKTRLLATRLSPTELSEFVKNGIFRQITSNKYYFTAVNGDYVITV